MVHTCIPKQRSSKAEKGLRQASKVNMRNYLKIKLQTNRLGSAQGLASTTPLSSNPSTFKEKKKREEEIKEGEEGRKGGREKWREVNLLNL
jgi:hypothetical protein